MNGDKVSGSQQGDQARPSDIAPSWWDWTCMNQGEGMTVLDQNYAFLSSSVVIPGVWPRLKVRSAHFLWTDST